MHALARCGLIGLLLGVHGCGGGSGGSDSSAVNAAPQIVTASIEPEVARQTHAGDIIRVSYVYADAEGDAEGATRISWRRDGTLVAAGSSASYALSHADAGSTVTAEITPKAAAGTADGLPVSVSLTIRLQPGERLELPPISSAYTGRTYPLFVRLPPGYADHAGSYPVIFALDGDRLFDTAARVLDERNTQAILVSIGSINQAQRVADFSITGASNYLNFLSLELLPYIEARFRTDPTQRVLTGHSRGGLFTALALLLESPDNRYFSTYLVHDGSFSSDNGAAEIVLMEEELYAMDPALPVRLSIAAATEGNLWGGQAVKRLFSRPAYSELDVTLTVYETTHSGLVEPALRDDFTALFP